MPDIQTGRFGRLIQTVFNLKQRMTLGQTLPDVMPTFELSDVQPEFKLHVNEAMCVGYYLNVAVAGQRGRTALQLPLGCGKIAVVDKIVIWTGAGAEFRLHLTAGVFGADAGAVEQLRDVRMAGRPVCQMRFNTAAGALGGAYASYNNLANVNTEISEPVVLGTGLLTGAQVASALVVEAEAVNQSFSTTFYWRERLLEPQENVIS